MKTLMVELQSDLGMDEAVTCLTSLAKVTLPTVQTMRHPLNWDVFMSSQGLVTDPAAEMLDMPVSVLCSSVF